MSDSTAPPPEKKPRLTENEDNMAGLSSLKLPEPQQWIIDDHEFPKVLSPAEESPAFSDFASLLEWVKSHSDWITHEVLPKHGSLLLRGFPINSPQEFSDFIDAFGWEYDDLSGGGGPRDTVVGKIYTSTNSPPEVHIPLHHEVAYLKDTPDRLVFYCEVEPAEGGETPTLLSAQLLANIEEAAPELVANIRAKGLRYIRKLEDAATADRDRQRPWQEVYSTEDRAEAETKSKASGTDTIEWTAEGTMVVTSEVFPGIVTSPVGHKKETWFNALALLHPAAHKGLGKNAPWTVVYGDFSEIQDAHVEAVIAQMGKQVAAPKWSKTDVLLVDNRVALHSRNPFTPPRRILAAILRK